MSEAERLAANFDEWYAFRTAVDKAIGGADAPLDPRNERIREAAAELRRLSAEVEALRKENAELKLLFPQTSPHGAEALGIVHRSPLMEFGMRNRQMGIEEGRRQHDAEVETLRKDAERYRWLRQLDAGGIQVYDAKTKSDLSFIGEELDAAVDAAMASRPGGQG